MADHYSIGEVLALLKEEFADITISKIRFLESQGLLNPERTASGYRRFYEVDIDQLRWILRQQRENFLPLKVIRERIDAGEIDATELDVDESSPSVVGALDAGETTSDPMIGRAETPAFSVPKPAFWAGSPSTPSAEATPALFRQHNAHVISSVSLTVDELADAAAVSVATIVELEKFGLILGRSVGGQMIYDHDALLVGRLASRFLAHGLEPRHLRMYVVSAQREAGVIEQIVQPLVRQRDAQATARVDSILAELVHLGGEIRSSLLRRSLAESL